MKIYKYKTAFILTGILTLLCLAAIVCLLQRPQQAKGNYTAYIYVNGELYEAIPLWQVTVPYQLTIASDDGGYNTILIQPDAIAITAADCPDQICVKQGAITNNLLPITCLPHGLVIELKSSETAQDSNPPDIITH